MTGTGRIGLWKIATDHYYRLDVVSKMIGSGGSYGSHNQYIAFLLKNGLIGLILLILFLYMIYRRIKQTNNLIHNIKSPYYALILSMFISVTFLTNQFIQIWDHVSFDYFFWGLCGMIISKPDEQS
jgi:O-antigen ligase